MVWGGHGLGFDSGASKKYPPNYQLAPAKIEIEGWRVSQMVQPCKGCGNECNEFNPNNVFLQIQDAQMKLCFMTASWIRKKSEPNSPIRNHWRQRFGRSPLFFSASNVRVKRCEGETGRRWSKRGFTFWLVQRVGSRRRETSLKVEPTQQWKLEKVMIIVALHMS